MSGPLADVAVLLIIALIAAAIGLGFGIVVLAPRIGRRIDPPAPKDEEASDGRD